MEFSRNPASNIHTLADAHPMQSKEKKKIAEHTKTQHLYHLYQTITTHQQLLFLLQFIQSYLQLRNVRVKTL